jgi:hypothetical protein
MEVANPLVTNLIIMLMAVFLLILTFLVFGYPLYRAIQRDIWIDFLIIAIAGAFFIFPILLFLSLMGNILILLFIVTLVLLLIGVPLFIAKRSGEWNHFGYNLLKPVTYLGISFAIFGILFVLFNSAITEGDRLEVILFALLVLSGPIITIVVSIMMMRYAHAAKERGNLRRATTLLCIPLAVLAICFGISYLFAM